MALAERAKLIAELSLDDKMTPAIQRIDRRLGAFSGAVNRNLGRAVDNAASFAARKLVGSFQSGIQALRNLDVVVNQSGTLLETAIGKRSGLTADRVREIAEAFEDVNAKIDDLDIQKAENVLITFGVGAKNIEDATESVLDFATATGKDAPSAAKLLGRAFSNPAKAAGILSRNLGTLSKEENKLLSEAAKTNGTLDDQDAVIKIISRRYKDSFANAGKDAEGAQARLQDKVEDLNKAFASGLLPVVTKVSDRLSSFLGKESTTRQFKELGDTIAGIFTDENLDTAASAIQTAAKAVSAALTAFNALPAPIKALAIGAFAINKVTGGAVGGIASGLGKALGAGLSRIFATNVTVVGARVSGPGGGIQTGTGTGTAGKVGVVSKGVSALGKVFLIGEAIGLVASVVAVQQEIAAGNSVLAASLHETLTRDIGNKTPEQLRTALAGVEQGINDLQANPLNVLVQGDALDTLKTMRAELKEAIAKDPEVKKGLPGIGQQLADGLKKAIPAFKIPELQKTLNANLTKLQGLQDKLHRAKESGDKQRVEALKGRMGEVKNRIDVSKSAIVQAQQATKAAATAAGARVAASTQVAATRVIAGFHQISPPTVNVYVTASNVQKTVTYQNRSGPGNGSAGGGGGGGRLNG